MASLDAEEFVQRAASAFGPGWPAEVAAPAARLSRHYIPTRYPDAHASGEPAMHYAPADAEQAVADARMLLAAFDEAWVQVSGP